MSRFEKGENFNSRNTEVHYGGETEIHIKTLCPYSDRCSKCGSNEHVKKFYHPCRYSNICYRKNTHHMNTYYHPCPFGKHCKNKDWKHHQMFSHRDENGDFVLRYVKNPKNRFSKQTSNLRSYLVVAQPLHTTPTRHTGGTRFSGRYPSRNYGGRRRRHCGFRPNNWYQRDHRTDRRNRRIEFQLLEELKRLHSISLDDHPLSLPFNQIRRKSRDSQNLLVTSHNYFCLGMFDEAINESTKCIELGEHDYEKVGYYARGLYYLAKTFMNQDDPHRNLFIQTEKDLSRYISLLRKKDEISSNHSIYSRYSRSKIRFMLERDTEALEDMLFVRKYMEDEFICNTIGYCFSNLKEFDKALKFFRRSLSLYSRNKPVYFSGGVMDTMSPASSHSNQRRVMNCGMNHFAIGSILLIRLGMKTFKTTSEDDLKQIHYRLSKCLEYIPENISCLLLRGFFFFHKLGNVEKALDDFSRAISVDENAYQTYMYRASVHEYCDDIKNAERDYLEACSKRNEEDVMPLLALGKFYSKTKEYANSSRYFKEALRIDPNNPYAYICRHFANLGVEPERSVEDFSKGMKLMGDRINGIEEDFFFSNLIQDLIDNPISLKKDEVLEFRKDDVEDQEIEEEKFLELRERLGDVQFSDLRLFRRLGKGAFGCVYLCLIKKFRDLFVLKLSKPQMKHNMDLCEKDCIDVPYHRNIAMVFRTKSEVLIDEKKLPDYDEFWKGQLDPGQKMMGRLVFSKYYFFDLRKYIKNRIEKGRHLNLLESCYILYGTLKGVVHLRRNGFVHLDLHSENVFLDATCGRVYVADFGCSLDLRNNPSGFVIHKDEVELWKNVTFYNSMYQKSNIGGARLFVDPEAYTKVNEGSIDLGKCDLFSIGVIGYILLSSGSPACGKCEHPNDPFHPCSHCNRFPYPIIEGGRDEYESFKFKALKIVKDGNGDSKYLMQLRTLIKQMLVVNPKNRCDYEFSEKTLNRIVLDLEKRNHRAGQGRTSSEKKNDKEDRIHISPLGESLSKIPPITMNNKDLVVEGMGDHYEASVMSKKYPDVYKKEKVYHEIIASFLKKLLFEDLSFSEFKRFEPYRELIVIESVACAVKEMSEKNPGYELFFFNLFDFSLGEFKQLCCGWMRVKEVVRNQNEYESFLRWIEKHCGSRVKRNDFVKSVEYDVIETIIS